MLETEVFIAGLVIGALIGFATGVLVYRNNVKTANSLAADATKALGDAKSEIGRLNTAAQKLGVKL
jgi:gas vesicle protein